MSDPVHTANERGLQVEPELSTTGFDVNAAAAEVRAELAPAEAPAAQRWTAADYGWDPADANAVAWAAYYSELGVDPVALAAQQAAEAAQAAQASQAPGELAQDAAPAAELELRLTPEAEPTLFHEALADEGAAAVGPAPSEAAAEEQPPLAAAEEPSPLEELSFSPISTIEGVLEAAPADLAPGLVDGGSAIWELLPADAAAPAPAAAAAPPPQPRPDLPAGWFDDERARLDDFQLASGGSFDEATAPIGDLADLSGDPIEAGGAPIPELPPLDPSLADDRAPAATDPQEDPPAEPISLPEVDLAAPSAELSIDLGFVEDDAVEVGAASVPDPAAPPPFELDLGPVPSAASHGQAAATSAEPEPVADVGWAAQAVPVGDAAVDLASFEAEPQLDVGPVPEGTAMWGLPGRGAAARRSAASAELLGDAAPLPTPASPPSSAELSEPVDGSLFLEPVLDPVEENAAAASPDPWDVPAPPAAELAPPIAAEPFDLGAAEAPPVAERGEEEILEIGEVVVELGAAEPVTNERHVTAPAAPGPSPVPAASIPPPAALAPAADEPLPGAELLAAFAEPAAPEPGTAAPPASFVAGAHRVVVHTSDGQVKRGTLQDTALDGPELQLIPQSGSAPEPLSADHVKAIFFMLAAGEPPPAPEGKKVRVTFRDGRQVAGFSPDYSPERVGFFMVPADTRTHTARIWVYRAAVRQVTVSP